VKRAPDSPVTLDQMLTSLRTLAGMGSLVGRTFYMSLVAEVPVQLGRHADAVEIAEGHCAWRDGRVPTHATPELWRIRARLAETTAARIHDLKHALAIAEERGALWRQLRFCRGCLVLPSSRPRLRAICCLPAARRSYFFLRRRRALRELFFARFLAAAGAGPPNSGS
jgi:hypothetical protein